MVILAAIVNTILLFLALYYLALACWLKYNMVENQKIRHTFNKGVWCLGLSIAVVLFTWIIYLF
jgi:hypothetical protein